jgi:hypothetical protein
MSTLQLLEEHPKVATCISEYYSKIMIDSLEGNDFPEEFKSFVREQKMDNDKIVEMIEKNPRNLFDFFDDNQIIIEIHYHPGRGGNFISIVSGEMLNTTFVRKDSERDAVEFAITKLEEELTELVSNKENS